MSLRVWLFVSVALLLLVGPASALGQAVDTSQKRALESDIQRYSDLLSARHDELSAIEAALGQTAAALDAQIAERDRVNAELRDLRAAQAELEQEVTRLEAQRDATEARITSLSGQLDDLKARIRGLLDNLYRQRSAGFAAGLARSKS